MLNAEKFKDEILETLDCDCEGFGVTEDNKITMCRADSFCCICSFLKDGFCSREAKDRWLLSEYKEPIKLSKVEYEILRYLYKRNYRYITREKSERVIAFKGRPHKRDYGVWNTISGEKIGFLDLYDFSNLFQFTNWKNSKPTSIEEVLKNCEVVDYD